MQMLFVWCWALRVLTLPKMDEFSLLRQGNWISNVIRVVGVGWGGGQYSGPWWKQSQPLNHLSSLHSITLSHCLLACYCFCFIYTSNVLCTKTSFQVVWEAFFPTNFTYNAFNDFEGKWVLGLGLAVFWLFLNERLICAKFVVLT